MLNNENNFFLNKTPSFLLKINMLSLLLEEIQNIKNTNKSEELYIFINNDNENNTCKLDILNSDKFLKNNVLAIVIGGEYEFKKLTLEENFITISLANENGEFIKNIIPYSNIIGFYKNKTLIKSYSITTIENIQLAEIYEYRKSMPTTVYKNSQLNYLINMIIKSSIKSIINNGLKENEIIKITFFENSIENVEENHKAKLLVLLIEDNSWNINIDKDNIIFNLKDIENYENIKELIIPINNIVTYLDTKHSILFNRYVKIIWDDFEDIDFTVYEKENLVFIDFNSLLEEEVTSSFSNIFKIPNLFLQDVNKNKDEDNLIIGNFDKNNDKEDKN